MLARIQGKGNTYSLLVGMQTGKATMDIGVKGPQKKTLRINLPQDISISLLSVYPEHSIEILAHHGHCCYNS